MTIKNIIFDFGGVLLDWDPRYLYRKVFKTEEEIENFLQNICTTEWNAQMDAGKPFAEGVKELIAIHPEYAKEIQMYKDRWTEMISGQIDEGVSILKQVEASHQFKLFGLTNWSSETFPFAYNNYKFLEIFEGIVVSGEEKMKKPEKRIFHLLLERYHLTPEECIFIDDNQNNIDMANKLGIHGILCQDFAKVKEEISNLTGLKLK